MKHACALLATASILASAHAGAGPGAPTGSASPAVAPVAVRAPQHATDDTPPEQTRVDPDAEDAARAVLQELPERWRIASATEREVGLVMRLAAALDRSGNGAYRAGLLRRLALHHPELRSPLAQDAGRTLLELADALPPAAPAPPAPATFDATCRSVGTLHGEHELLGELRTQGGERLVLAVHLDRSTGLGKLFALAQGSLQEPIWCHELAVSRPPRPWSERFAVAGERCLLALEGDVLALDGETGKVAWERSLNGGEPELLIAEDGVVLVVVRGPDRQASVHALDARHGTPLWSVDAADPTLLERPLVAEGHVVFLPHVNHERLVVRDLFTGKLAHEYELPAKVKDPGRTLYEGCWIEDGKLILPWFLAARFPERNHILAVDLERGELAWRVALPEPDGVPRDLHSILQHDGRTYLVLFTAQNARRVTVGEIRELRTDVPALSDPLDDLRLAPGDRLFGVQRRERVALPTPHVFVRSPAGDTTRLRMIDLGGGERWAHVVPVPVETLYNGLMPQPALSDTTVAFVYTEWQEGRRSDTRPTKRTSLALVDRQTGLVRDTRLLADDLGGQDRIELVPFGSSLLMRGRSQLEILE